MRAEFPPEFLDAREFAVIERMLERLSRLPKGCTPRALGRALRIDEAALSRLFRRWAGISLNQFVEATIHLASPFAAAHALALRGAHRLHDHSLAFVHDESGELVWGRSRSPFGECVLAESSGGLVGLDFLDDLHAQSQAWLASFARRQARRDDRHAGVLARRVFGGQGRLALDLGGTPFQREVWRVLAAADSLGTLTYADLARGIGRPGASRAVGNAVGRNPILWLIPCHHVLRTDGSLGGFRAGVDRKRAMLVWESLAAPS